MNDEGLPALSNQRIKVVVDNSAAADGKGIKVSAGNSRFESCGCCFLSMSAVCCICQFLLCKESETSEGASIRATPQELRHSA